LYGLTSLIAPFDKVTSMVMEAFVAKTYETDSV
jgi:hypothetical protein